MDSRATTRTRLSVIPIFIALLVNMVVPVLTVAVPQVTPTALRPQVAEAAAPDPNHVAFALEGCRLENGTFIEATVTCTDPAYTSGNLGKEWNELDLVPHRLTTQRVATGPRGRLKPQRPRLPTGSRSRAASTASTT